MKPHAGVYNQCPYIADIFNIFKNVFIVLEELQEFVFLSQLVVVLEVLLLDYVLEALISNVAPTILALLHKVVVLANKYLLAQVHMLLDIALVLLICSVALVVEEDAL
jgi:hypothetical protein